MICNKSLPLRLFERIAKSLRGLIKSSSYQWTDQPPNLIRRDIGRKSGNFYRLTIFQYPGNTRENRSRQGGRR